MELEPFNNEADEIKDVKIYNQNFLIRIFGFSSVANAFVFFWVLTWQSLEEKWHFILLLLLSALFIFLNEKRKLAIKTLEKIQLQS